MPHKMITDRQKVDEALVVAIHRHRDGVLTGLESRLEPFLPEGANVSGFAAFYDALPGLVTDAGSRLVEASRRVVAERTDDRARRKRRDDAKVALRTTLVSLRRTAVALSGETAGERLVRIDQTPTLDPQRILEQGEVTLAQLRKSDLETPASVVPGQPPLDVAAWTATLEPQVTELREALAVRAGGGPEITACVQRCTVTLKSSASAWRGSRLADTSLVN